MLPASKFYSPSKLIHLLALPIIGLSHLFYRLVLKLSTVERIRPELFPERRAKDTPAIYLFWHSKSFYIVPIVKSSSLKFLTLSNFIHWITQKMTRMPEEKRLVVHSRERVYFQIMRELKKKTSVLIACDGPSGPSGQVKKGVLYLAERLKCPVIAMKVESLLSIRVPWRWDRYELGLPFNRVKITADQLIFNGLQSEDAFQKQLQSLLGSP